MQNVAATCNLKIFHILLQLTFFCLASTADLLWPKKVCSSGQTLIAGNIFEWENQHLIIFNSSLRLPFWCFFSLQKCGQWIQNSLRDMTLIQLKRISQRSSSLFEIQRLTLRGSHKMKFFWKPYFCLVSPVSLSIAKQYTSYETIE